MDVDVASTSLMVVSRVVGGRAAPPPQEWLRPLDPAGVEALLAAAAAPTSPMSLVLLRIMGGAISRVPAAATALRYREAAAMLTVAAMWPEPTTPARRTATGAAQDGKPCDPASSPNQNIPPAG